MTLGERERESEREEGELERGSEREERERAVAACIGSLTNFCRWPSAG